MDRAEAIRYLESMATDLTGACVAAQSEKVSDYIARKIQAIDMALAALREQELKGVEIDTVKNEWISVEERLPAEFVSVLGYMTDAGEFPPVRECYLVGGVFFFPALRDRHPVTHWMPLPSPPKEEV